MIKIKRVYEKPSRNDGKRILIDRLWPRGLRKEEARIDEWAKDLAPSAELRQWFGHDPEKWKDFRKCFSSELGEHEGRVEEIRRTARKGTVTLLFGSKEERFNNAVALKEYIESRGRARKKAA